MPKFDRSKFFVRLVPTRQRFDNCLLKKFNYIPGDQEGLFKLAIQLRKFFNSVIYNTATGYVQLVYLTHI
jgi:hypothetical protein